MHGSEWVDCSSILFLTPMRRPLVLALAYVALTSCRASASLEPLSGFELVTPPEAAAWSALGADELGRWLDGARARLGPVADYRAVLATRERIGEELFPRRVLRVALRHAPFAVAIETDEPPAERGQRVWFDESWNDGELVAETPGFLGRLVGRLSLDPEGALALENRRHPLTDIGLRRLDEQIVEQVGPALVAGAVRLRCATTSIDGRVSRVVEAELARTPPEPALGYRFGFDVESGLLVYFGSAELGPDGPALLEEYLYTGLELDLGLTDADFRPPE